MKDEMTFTADELRTLCWMCQAEAAHMAVREHHKSLDTNSTYQRILSISHKAYAKLTEMDEEAEK